MAAILTAKSWREFLDMAAIPRLNWVMSTRFSASSTRLVSGRSGVRPPNAAPGQTTYGPSGWQRVTAILTAKRRAGGFLGVLCDGRPWVKALVQTVVLTATAGLTLAISEAVFRVRMSW